MLKDINASVGMISYYTMVLIAAFVVLSVVVPLTIELMGLTLDTYLTPTPSSSVQVTATPVVVSTPVQNVGEPIKTTNLNIHTEKTNVVVGEDILVKLSAVNLITKKTMHIQVILTPPSGMGVSTSTFVFSGAGQYTSDFRIEPGQGRDIEIRLVPNQVGDFSIEGRAVYYFGDDIINSEDYYISVPVHVRANPATMNVAVTESQNVKPTDIVVSKIVDDSILWIAPLIIIAYLLSAIILICMPK